MKDISEQQPLNLSDLGDDEIFVSPDVDPIAINKDTGQISNEQNSKVK